MASIINASNTSGLTFSSDLSGTLQFQQNGVAMPNGGTAPTFSAYLSSVQSFTANTWTKVQCNTKEWDTANCYDNTTNYRFTPTVAGYYQASGMFTNATAAAGIATSLYKNGVSYKRLYSTNATSNSSSGGGTCLVYLNGSTDYIELWALTNSTQNGYAVADSTYFQATLVRGA
jgi:hypothetical protein